MGAYASAEANAKRRREDPRKSSDAVPAQGGQAHKSTSSSHHRSSKKKSTSKSNGRQPSPADAQRSRSKSHSPEKTGAQKSTPHIPSSSRTTPTPPPPPQKASKGRSCPAHHHKGRNVDRGFTGEYFLLQSGNQLKTSEPVERTGAASAPLTAYEREGYAASPPEACGGNTRTPSSPEDGHFPLQRKEVLPFTSFRGMVAQAHSQAVAEDRRVTVKPERRGRRKNKNDQTKVDERDYNNNNAFRPPLSPPLQARAASNIMSGCASLTEYSFFGYLSNESVERPARRPTTANSRGHNTNTYPFTCDNRDDEFDEDEEDEGDAESEFEIRAPSSASESSSVSTIATQSDVTMHSNHTASTTAEAAATATRGLAVAYSYFNISKAQKAKAQRRAEDDDVSADARSRLARKGTFGMRMPAGKSVVFHQGIQDSFRQPPSRRSSVALKGGDNGSAYDDFLDTFLLSDRNSTDGLRPAATCIVDENNNNNNKDMTHPDNFLYSVDSRRRVDNNTDNSNNRRRPSPSSAKPAPPPPQLVGTVTSTAARRPYRLPQPIMHGAPSMQTRSRPFDVERVLDFPLRSIVRIPSPDWRALGMHEDMPNYQSPHSPMNSPRPLQTVQQQQARRRGPFGFNVPRSF